ncbi:MAG TPA: phosphotransferase [Actinoplanes sp.]|nr:phosphotransferase [Actinoplanes sp.]
MLLEVEGSAPEVLIHGDFRLDQLLKGSRAWIVTDWEDFGRGDAARDLGCLVGQWIQRSILDIVSTPGAETTIDLSHEDVLRRGSEALLSVQPLLERFWCGYRNERPATDETLAVRVAAFAGWHLIERMLASANRSTRVSGLERAAAGIGRTMLLRPSDFVAVLGTEAVDAAA